MTGRRGGDEDGDEVFGYTAVLIGRPVEAKARCGMHPAEGNIGEALGAAMYEEAVGRVPKEKRAEDGARELRMRARATHGQVRAFASSLHGGVRTNGMEGTNGGENERRFAPNDLHSNG